MICLPGQGAWQGAPAGATLTIAEGFETAAAFMQFHDTPYWASLGARRLDQLALRDGIQTLIIFEDDDLEGRQAAGRTWARYRRDRLVLRRRPPPSRADDWADVLEQRG